MVIMILILCYLTSCTLMNAGDTDLVIYIMQNNL